MTSSALHWHKSSYSNGDTNCVEHAATDVAAYVRDSKDREGAVLTFDRDAWASFLAAVRNGHLD